MNQKIHRISGWVRALIATILVLAFAAGCGNGAAAHSEPESGITQTLREEKTAAAESGPTEAGPTETAAPESERSGPRISVEEDGAYTSKEEVAYYLHLYGRLPSNFITKKEAEELGWKQKSGEAGQLDQVAPGMSIGGDRFGNYEGLLPDQSGRKYYECDINYVKGNRGAERIIYSNDGLIFYTGDHYKSFEQLYPEESE